MVNIKTSATPILPARVADALIDLYACYRPDFQSELSFWKKWLPENWRELSDRQSWKSIFPQPLLKHILEFQKIYNRKPVLLEVGSGPASLLAYAQVENLCEITAIDPLADEYQKLMATLNYHYPIKPIKGRCEKLLKQFKKSTFDIVYTSNALDHTQSPKHAFENMYEITRDGGVMIVEGYVNTGSFEKWSGLHRFNLQPQRNDLLCINRSGKVIALSRRLNIQCEHCSIIKSKDRACGTPFVDGACDDWFTIAFRKIGRSDSTQIITDRQKVS